MEHKGFDENSQKRVDLLKTLGLGASAKDLESAIEKSGLQTVGDRKILYFFSVKIRGILDFFGIE